MRADLPAPGHRSRSEYLRHQVVRRRLGSPSPVRSPAVPVQRLNHAVLYVRDVDRSVAFYRDVLGFRVKVEIPGRAAFLQAEASTNDHDLGLFAVGSGAGPSEAGRRTVGLYHLAWEVDTLAELARVRDALLQAGALVGASDHA